MRQPFFFLSFRYTHFFSDFLYNTYLLLIDSGKVGQALIFTVFHRKIILGKKYQVYSDKCIPMCTFQKDSFCGIVEWW